MVLGDSDVSEDNAQTTWFGLPGKNRYYAMGAYLLAFAVWWKFLGLPTDPMMVGLWLWALTIAWNVHKPRRDHLRFARDWAPVVLFLIIYDFSRGLAKTSTPHVTEMIDADKALFGGHIPTVWLQEHLYDPNTIHWYDVAASWVYFSHFVVCFAIAAILWLRKRSWWAAFMRRWLALIVAGLATYFLFPAAPPWWASEHGYILEEVVRISSRGWQAIGLGTAGKLLSIGQALSNPVAAMPSLHTGFSACAIAFFLPRVRKRWWPLLIAYPVAMAATLTYTGEHYVIDAIVGALYVAVIFVAMHYAEKWWRKRRRLRESAELDEAVDLELSGAAVATATSVPASADLAGSVPPTEKT